MEEGRQQRALSPCVIWTRQGYALMFPVTEASVLFSCGTRWFSAQADDRRFFVLEGTRSTLIFAKPWRSERRLSAFHKGGRGQAGPLPPPLPERGQGSKAERRLYNEQRKSQGGNDR